MARKSSAGRADDGVRWLGMPSLLAAFERADDRRRRHLRMLPIAALLLAATGTAYMLLGARPQLAGPLLFFGGFILAVALPTFGPMKPWGSIRMDEYDRRIRRSAYLFAYAVATWSALASFTLIGVWLREGATTRQVGYALALSGGWMLILTAALPTLWASWNTRPPEREE